MKHQEIHAKLVKTLQTPAAKSLADLIHVGLADVDAGRETSSAKKIKAITHQVYFDRTNFANSSGREYIWIFDLADAARTARDNAPAKICKYLSEEEAIHWLRQAQATVDDLIETVEKLNIES